MIFFHKAYLADYIFLASVVPSPSTHSTPPPLPRFFLCMSHQKFLSKPHTQTTSIKSNSLRIVAKTRIFATYFFFSAQEVCLQYCMK